MNSRAGIASTSLLVVLLLAAPGGCSRAPDQHPDTEEFRVDRRTTEDGVPIVRTASGSKWGGPGRLVEEVVIGGPEATEDEYIFGNPFTVWSTSERIYVVDSAVPVVRVYDSEGKHLQDMGRSGQGPGEFTQPYGVAVDSDGRVLVADPQQHRVIRFAPDGAHIDTWSWTSSGVTYASPPLRVAPNGRAWVISFTIADRSDLDSWQLGYLSVGPDGFEPLSAPPKIPGYEPVEVEVDTPSGSRTFDWVVPFAPQERWAMSPDGTWFVGSGADYRIHATTIDGERCVIERYWTPIEVLPGEAEAHLRRAEVTVRQNADRPDWQYSGPDVPDTKPAYIRLAVDYSDRIWVERPGTGIPIEGCNLEEVVESRGEPPCWTQERYWDVFSVDGEYLGEVPVPADAPDITQPHIQDDRITLARPDAVGNPQIVRYRLEIPTVRPSTDDS